jgi:retron-type reverse transcriptase
MDLSKFFDRVSHDRLMSKLAGRIKDKRVLKVNTFAIKQHVRVR